MNTEPYIIKGIGGFYYVKTADGVVECRAKGIFRKRGITPVAGDRVRLEHRPTQPSLPRCCRAKMYLCGRPWQCRPVLHCAQHGAARAQHAGH
ncbi:MAG: hypothetical protein ACLRWF_04195 [Ruthenibacterium sp.]